MKIKRVWNVRNEAIGSYGPMESTICVCALLRKLFFFSSRPSSSVSCCFFSGWLVGSQITAPGYVMCRMQMKTKLLFLFIYLWGFYRFSFIEYVYYRIMHSDLALNDVSSFHFDIHTLLVLAAVVGFVIMDYLFVYSIRFTRRYVCATVATKYNWIYHFPFSF